MFGNVFNITFASSKLNDKKAINETIANVIVEYIDNLHDADWKVVRNDIGTLYLLYTQLSNIKPIRGENGHEIINMSLLRTVQDDELMKYRNVGKTTIEKVQEIRKSLDWM